MPPPAAAGRTCALAGTPAAPAAAPGRGCASLPAAASAPRRVRRGATAPARGCGGDDALLRFRFQAILRYEDRGRPHPPARRDGVPLAPRTPGRYWQRCAATICGDPARSGRAPAVPWRVRRRPVPPAACAAAGAPDWEGASALRCSAGRV